ncbi:hypothetical protein JCM3775_000649 [Rhodotorula graminis]
MGQGQSQQRTDPPAPDVAPSSPPSPPQPHQPEPTTDSPAALQAAQPVASAPSDTSPATAADPGSAVVAALSAAAPLAVEHDAGDTFKVPALPTATSTTTSPSSTLRALPADIEHILSLGAADPDHAELAAAARGTAELEQVVRELKDRATADSAAARAGEVKMEADGDEEDEQDGGGDELRKVEDEMRAQGVTRGAEVVEVEHEEEGEVMGGEGAGAAETAQAGAQDRMQDDDDSSDSDSSSSSDSDAAMEAALAPRQRNRRGKQRAAAAAAAGDSDLDDDDGESGMASSKTAPKTEHEVVEPDVAPPPVAKIDDQAELARFGKVESVIETVVVVKADTGGDWRVLDEGTVVCWEDRTVIGTIFETFGSVQQPFYSIRFPSSSPPDPAVFTHARAVFYSPNLASFVFTRDLRKVKGSDASNIWDEEVAANELEFSDDEEEAEYKRKLKADRRARTQSATPGPSGSRGSRAPSSAAPPPTSSSSSGGPPSHLPARPAVSYADTADDFLTPSVPSAAPMNPGPAAPGPRATMGTAPPPGRVGRRMFERDTGATLEEGEEVEFEFSSGEGSEGEEQEDEEREGGFGGARGGRGGRGGAQRGGQRGGATAGARGRGRGGRGGGVQATSTSSPGGRPIAGMPRGRVATFASTPVGLPSKPTFEADFAMADGATDAPTRMSAPASSSSSTHLSQPLPPPPPPSSNTAAPYSFGAAPPPTGAFTFGAPPSGPSATRSPPQPQPQPHMPWSGAPPSGPSAGYSPNYGAAPTGPRGGGAQPSYPGAGAYRAAPPPPPPSHYYGGPGAYGYPAAPPPLGPPGGGGGGAGGYSPHAPYASGPGAGGEGYNPIAVQGGGHLNPRFFAAQQAAQQGQGQGQRPGQQGGGGAGGGAQGGQGYYPAQGGQGGYGGQGRW